MPSLLLALATTAAAYTIDQTSDGDPVRWPEFPVSFAWVDGTLDGVDDPESELRSSFATWTLDGTPIGFRSEAPTGRPSFDYDTVNYVWIQHDWPFDPDLLALTNGWTDDDGNIVAFDIQINAERPFATDGRKDAFDFEATMTHEVGHVLGLEHTEIVDATMFPSLPIGTTARRALHEDDDAGARFLYPTGTDDGAGRTLGELVASCSVVGHPGGWTLAALALAAVRRRR
ncbi:MAG: matrixin family metalloprotease [Myxococcota bacterium]